MCQVHVRASKDSDLAMRVSKAARSANWRSIVSNGALILWATLASSVWLLQCVNAFRVNSHEIAVTPRCSSKARPGPAKVVCIARQRSAAGDGLKHGQYAPQQLLAELERAGSQQAVLALLSDAAADGVSLHVEQYSTAIRTLVRLQKPAAALRLLREGQQSGVTVDLSLYDGVIQAYSQAGDTWHALQLLAEMEQQGLDISEYSYVQAIYIAQRTDARQAMQLLQQVKNRGLRPNEATYATCLDACAAHSAADQSVVILDMMQQAGVQPSEHCYSSAGRAISDRVSKYAAAGKLQRLGELMELVQLLAEPLSTRLYSTCINTCAAVVQASVAAGEWQHALQLLVALAKAGVQLNESLYSSVVDAASRAGDRAAAVRGLQELISSELQLAMTTYETCFVAYAQHKAATEALELLGIMQRRGLQLTAMIVDKAVITCQLNIQAYIAAGQFQQAQHLMQAAVAANLKPPEAWHRFYIDVCAASAAHQQIVQLLNLLQDCSTAPAVSMYERALDACIMGGAAETALNILRDMQQHGLQPSNACKRVAAAACRTAIEQYAAATEALESWLLVNDAAATNLEEQSSLREFWSSSSIAAIQSLAAAGLWRVAHAMLHYLVAEGVQPGAKAYEACIAACTAGRGNLKAGLRLLIHMEETSIGMQPCVALYKFHIEVCISGSDIETARDILAAMQPGKVRPDAACYDSIIAACEASGNRRLAQQLFEEMRASNLQPSVFSCNVMMNACIAGAAPSDALKVFSYMQSQQLALDTNSYNLARQAACFSDLDATLEL
jgi:hypothetical protein